MTIGIDASRANLEQRTGTEWYSLRIIQQLVVLDRDTRFILYLDREPLPELQQLGPNVELRILRWKLGILWSQLRLSWEMLRRKPDVLFVPAHTMPIIHPRRTVVTIHDLGFEHDPSLYGNRSLVTGPIGLIVQAIARVITLGRYGANELDYHRWSARYAARHASQIITVSHYSRRDLHERYGVPAERLSVIYHGYDTQAFKPHSPIEIQVVRERFGLASPYLFFIGRLERKKNILGLVRIFARIADHIPNLDLVLAGRPGLGWDEARDFIRMSGIEPRVRQLGWIRPDDYTLLLSGASALTFLSRFEGFGLPVIEAFAVGTPVVCSDDTSLPEIAGDAAMIVRPEDETAAADAIINLLSDQALRSGLIQRGRERLNLFDWKQAAGKTLSVLKAVRVA